MIIEFKKNLVIRPNHWGSCFYDCIYTCCNYFNKDYYPIYLGLLSFYIDNKRRSWNDVILNNNSIHDNLRDFCSINVEIVSDIKSIGNSKNTLNVVDIETYFWKKNRDYCIERENFHYVIARMQDERYEIIDPYFNQHFYCEFEEMNNAFVKNITFYCDSIHNKMEYEVFFNLLKQDIFKILDNLKDLDNFTNKFIFLDGIYDFSKEIAGRIEIYALMLMHSYPQLNNLFSDYQTDFVRIILRWQAIKSISTKNVIDEKSIRKEINRSIEEMIKLFQTIQDRLLNIC